MKREGRTRPQKYPVKEPLAGLPKERRAEIAAELLRRYQDGEQLAEMAPEYGYSPVSLYALLWKEREDDWCNAQASRALARHAEALSELDAVKRGLEAATGEGAQIEISRQRELLKVAEARLKSAQWELEKLMRRMYGVDVPHVAVQFNVGDVSTKIATLERELGVGAAQLVQTQSEQEPTGD